MCAIVTRARLSFLLPPPYAAVGCLTRRPRALPSSCVLRLVAALDPLSSCLVSPIFHYSWHISHSLHNRLMHALHGNGVTGPYASFLRQVRYRLHNVCGWRDDHFRRNYMRRAKCDILAVLETNCSSDDEALEWAKDWDGQSFWASQPRDSSVSSLGSHRGVALLLRASPAIGVGRVVASDPLGGRFLAVLVPVYDRPTLIVVVHADTGATQASSLRAVRDAVSFPPGTLDVHLMIDTNNTPSSLDYIRLDPRQPHSRSYSSRYSHPGHAALSSLLAHLRDPCDAFRALHPRELSFTYTHLSGGDVVSTSLV